MNTRHYIVTLATAASFGLAAAACADNNNPSVDSDAQRARAATVSMADAIATAEQSKNGKAFEASIDDSRSGDYYEISVAVGAQVFEVDIDAESGEVLREREDNDDAPVQLGVSLDDITRAAASHHTGLAYEVECENEDESVLCEVDVITPANESYEVVVNGTTGDVVSSKRN